MLSNSQGAIIQYRIWRRINPNALAVYVYMWLVKRRYGYNWLVTIPTNKLYNSVPLTPTEHSTPTYTNWHVTRVLVTHCAIPTYTVLNYIFFIRFYSQLLFCRTRLWYWVPQIYYDVIMGTAFLWHNQRTFSAIFHTYDWSTIIRM